MDGTTWIMWIPKESRKRNIKIFETIIWEFPWININTKTQVQEIQRTLVRINARKISSSHIVFKLQSIEINFKKSWKTKQKENSYLGAKIKVKANFISETWKQESRILEWDI